jgi:hypothetical protein
MPRNALEGEHRGFSGSIVENRLADWPMYVALVPGIVSIAAAILLAIAAFWHDRRVSNATSANEISKETDDYVVALAQLGICSTSGA